MFTLTDNEVQVLRSLIARIALSDASRDIPLPSGPIGYPEKPEKTFEKVSRSWHGLNKSRWTDMHSREVMASLERHVFPILGKMGIGEITAPVALSVLRSIEHRGAIETAHRIRQRISAIFSYAIAEGIALHDPVAKIGKAMSPIPIKIHRPALLKIGDCRKLLAAIELVEARPSFKLASRYLALTTVPLMGIRFAKWSEIENLEGPFPIWRVPAERTKMMAAQKKDTANGHLIPLSYQAVSVLRTAAQLGPSEDGIIFPDIGESALGSLCKRAGYAGRHVPHGWRASFSTIMNERFPKDRAIIDMALGHSPKDKIEAAYNRATQMKRRRIVLQRWADLLMPVLPAGQH